MAAYDLEEAHEHSSCHRAELERSKRCGCFYCRETFAPSEIQEWIPDGASEEQGTALCPRCGVDSVLGDASGLPLEPAFLQVMHERWFGLLH